MNGFEFCKKHDLCVDVPYKIWKGVEFAVVDIAFSESYIPTQKNTYCMRLSWVLENFDKLLQGRYKREDMKHTPSNECGMRITEQWNSQEGKAEIARMNEIFNKIKPEEL